MRRVCYSDQESEWIETLCYVMNRWAMATAQGAAEASRPIQQTQPEYAPVDEQHQRAA
jgi:hypothetical protein